jgi:tRNA pseudouridine38-40 synthase
MRIKLEFSYDGSKFDGFQIQTGDKNVKSVAGTIKKTLQTLNISSELIGSGRTDKDVHASNQVAHLDLPTFWSDLKKLKTTLNNALHPHIHIKKITPVSKDFHARFDAKKRLYRYICYEGSYNPFYAPYALHVTNLDLKKLNTILKFFEGEHDFTYFKKEGSPTTHDKRTIFKAYAYRRKNFIVISLLGNGFLRSQVRMMLSISFKVLEGKLTFKELEEQIAKKEVCSRSLVKPNGLYLSKIFY